MSRVRIVSRSSEPVKKQTDGIIDRLLDYIPDLNRLMDWSDYIERELNQKGFRDTVIDSLIQVYQHGIRDGKREVLDLLYKTVVDGGSRG